MNESFSIFEKIAFLNAGGIPGERRPAYDSVSVLNCVNWLRDAGLTMENCHSLIANPTRDPAGILNQSASEILAFPGDRRRASRIKKPEKEKLKNDYRTARGKMDLPPQARDHLWREFRNPGYAVRRLDPARVPADALAFYRPFHLSPHEEWGIYLLADRLLGYSEALYRLFSKTLAAFTRETLMGCILFEVFHHEFFHHLTECTATSFEIASAAFGNPKAIYVDYWNDRFQKTLGEHPDHPLEEALANAYAYNSFSFLSRTEIGVRLVWVRLYQEMLKLCWPKEPEGYRSAGKYINGDYVSGGAQLLAMLLSSAGVDPASLMLLAKTVMPSGNSAFLQKPDIPTYIVGRPDVLQCFYELVPAPNETYTTLFWLGDTSEIDKYLRYRKKEEADAKKFVLPRNAQ